MWNPFKRIHCQCTSCGCRWKIPRRRIIRFEQFFEIKKGQTFVWECHGCHKGVVIPGSYINSFGEKVEIDPKKLDQNIRIVRF